MHKCDEKKRILVKLIILFMFIILVNVYDACACVHVYVCIAIETVSFYYCKLVITH